MWYALFICPRQMCVWRVTCGVTCRIAYVTYIMHPCEVLLHTTTPHHYSTPLVSVVSVRCYSTPLLHRWHMCYFTPRLHTTTPHHYSTPLLHTTTPHHLYVTSPALLICEQTNRYVTYVYGTWSYGTWLIHMGHHSFIWDMTHSYGTCLIHMGHASDK